MGLFEKFAAELTIKAKMRVTKFKRKKIELKTEHFSFIYLERGKPASELDRPSVLYIPSLICPTESGMFLMAHLPSIHSVLVQMPGQFGTTYKKSDHNSIEGHAKRIHEFVRAIGLDKSISGIHVIGHSLGAMVAATYVIKYKAQDNVRLLTLMSPCCWSPERTQFYDELVGDFYYYILGFKGFRIFMGKLIHYLPAYRMTKVALRGQYELIKPYRRDIYKCWLCYREDFVNEQRVKTQIHLWKLYIDVPMQIIIGDKDEISHFSLGQYMSDLLQCDLHIIKDSGHMTVMENLNETSKIIMDFRKSYRENYDI